MAELLKCESVVGRNIHLRRVQVSDASFILSLRLDPLKSRYISPTSDSLELQQQWIQRCIDSPEEVLFIISDKTGRNLGSIRMYSPNSLNYTWGSWLLLDGLSPSIAVESLALLYSYGKYLGFDHALLDVRKENTSVWKFHEKVTGAKLVSEDHLDKFYVVCSEEIDKFLTRFSTLLCLPLEVIGIEK